MPLPFISDVRLFLSLLVTGLAIVAWFWISAALHRRNRNAIGIRIHVAGSRGKTTVTRLIGAALREAGIPALVKTTGTDPILIQPDGRELPWARWAPPSISEQIRFFRRARREGATAVVLESMAIQPEYLWASEHYLVRATHTVITNARSDHVEEVGDDPMAAAEALSLVVPVQGRLFVADEAAVPAIMERARARLRSADDILVIPVEGLLHDEANRGLALAVCRDLGIADAIAMAGFDKAGQDPGAFFVKTGRINGQEFHFANAFSCNDPQSLRQLWHESAGPGRQVVLFNPRPDRPERTRAFLTAFKALTPPVSEIHVTGHVPKRWLLEAGLSPAIVKKLNSASPAKVLDQLSRSTGPNGMIWGIGNYAAFGRKLTQFIGPMEPPSC